jgi:hypothetical protein
MSVMDIAHGRHARHPGFALEPLAQLGNSLDDFHFLRGEGRAASGEGF